MSCSGYRSHAGSLPVSFCQLGCLLCLSPPPSSSFCIGNAVAHMDHITKENIIHERMSCHGYSLHAASIPVYSRLRLPTLPCSHAAQGYNSRFRDQSSGSKAQGPNNAPCDHVTWQQGCHRQHLKPGAPFEASARHSFSTVHEKSNRHLSRVQSWPSKIAWQEVTCRCGPAGRTGT